MAFRGYLALNNNEIANSSRVAAHLGQGPLINDALFGATQYRNMFALRPDDEGFYSTTDLPPLGEEDDDGVYGTGYLYPDEDGLYPIVSTECEMYPWLPSPLLYWIPDYAIQYRAYATFPFTFPASWESRKLYHPPDGSRRYGPGLYQSGDCWESPSSCSNCRVQIEFDDTWTGLQDYLTDTDYRPELAPWYTVELPESAEFGGVWVMDIIGLDSTPVARSITETVRHGGVAAPHRDTSRPITVEALLIGCTNAGVDYGLKWLNCLLRSTADNTSTRLRYLSAHPEFSNVDARLLARDLREVVLTKAPEIVDSFSSGPNRQATVYRVSWEMVALNPYAYHPAVSVNDPETGLIPWDRITRQPVNWIHAADCRKPETCDPMPIMFSTECVPEEIEVVNVPPPVCGGCMPVSAIDKYSFQVPTHDYPFRCRETAVSLTITNTGETPLTLQGFWRVCGADVRCEDNQFPLQISGLPAGAELHLDGVTGKYWAWYDERIRRPVGVVGTPHGAPWRPPLIDRKTCWDFIVQTASTSEFTVSMELADREA